MVEMIELDVVHFNSDSPVDINAHSADEIEPIMVAQL